MCTVKHFIMKIYYFIIKITNIILQIKILTEIHVLFSPTTFEKVYQETLELNVSLDKQEPLEQKVSKIYYSNISNKWNLEAFSENDFHLNLERLSEPNVCHSLCFNICTGTLY